MPQTVLRHNLFHLLLAQEKWCHQNYELILQLEDLLRVLTDNWFHLDFSHFIVCVLNILNYSLEPDDGALC